MQKRVGVVIATALSHVSTNGDEDVTKRKTHGADLHVLPSWAGEVVSAPICPASATLCARVPPRPCAIIIRHDDAVLRHVNHLVVGAAETVWGIGLGKGERIDADCEGAEASLVGV